MEITFFRIVPTIFEVGVELRMADLVFVGEKRRTLNWIFYVCFVHYLKNKECRGLILLFVV